MVGRNGVDYFCRLTIFPGHFSTDDRVRPLNLMRDGFPDIVEQSGTFGLLLVEP